MLYQINAFFWFDQQSSVPRPVKLCSDQLIFQFFKNYKKILIQIFISRTGQVWSTSRKIVLKSFMTNIASFASESGKVHVMYTVYKFIW
jgi:hypothetical protein